MHDRDVSYHISASDLSGFLDNDLTDAARREVEAHLETCARCRRELVEVQRIAASYRPSAGPQRRWVQVGIGLAIAAGLAGVLLVPGVRSPVTPDSTPVRAQAPGREGRARIEAVTPEAGATMSDGGVTFTWRASTADVYRLTVLTESGEPVWSVETTDTSVSVPSAATLVPGVYFWRVDAIADGITATTGVRRLVVGP